MPTTLTAPRPHVESRRTMTPPEQPERLVKSTERVRDLGEVFTPAATVEAMLDLLPDAMWEPHPAPTFLEPACGDGNFLVAILHRKLIRISEDRDAGTLAAGDDIAAVGFHGLEALASIYAVDISLDNIIGGTPGHELGARDRLLQLFIRWYAHDTGTKLTGRNLITQAARWIVDHNIQVGNMLAFDNYGGPSGRETIPLVEYTWNPASGEVAVAATTLGDVMSESSPAVAPTLFDTTTGPQTVWTGPAHRLRDAPIPDPVLPTEPARNGKRRR